MTSADDGPGCWVDYDFSVGSERSCWMRDWRAWCWGPHADSTSARLDALLCSCAVLAASSNNLGKRFFF